MPRSFDYEREDYEGYSDPDDDQWDPPSSLFYQEPVLSGARWHVATGGNILTDPTAPVYRRDHEETHPHVGELPPPARTFLQRPLPDPAIEVDYDGVEQAPQMSTKEFENDRVFHMDSSHSRIPRSGDHEYLLDDLSGTIYQTFIPDTLQSRDDWALYHLRFERLSRRSPITIDFAYAGSLNPSIPTCTHELTLEPGYARIKSLLRGIKEADPPFDRKMSFRESQICLDKLERAARKTGERMRAEGSIQIEKLVSACPKEDHEEGEDQWSHSAWVSVKPMIRM